MGKEVHRDGCWESNSSAQHVIVMKNEGRMMNHDEAVDHSKRGLYVWKNGDVLLNKGDVAEGYNRYPFTPLVTPEEKIQYALCSLCGNYDYDNPLFKEEYERVLNAVREVVPEVKDFDLIEGDVVLYFDEQGKQWKRENLIYGEVDEEVCCGYEDENGDFHRVEEVYTEDTYPMIGGIEDGSEGLLQDFLTNRGISLAEFIFNDKYIVFVDGDEYNYFGKLLDSGVIDKSKIAEVVK